MFYFWTLVSVSEHCWRWRIRPKHLKCSVWLFCDPCVMFQNTNVLFLNTFDAILNIMDTNACVLSVECIYSVSKHLDSKSKHIIYNSFVASNFNYCPLVWHFCGQVNNNKLEKLQERSLRIIHNDYESSFETLLKCSKQESLLTKRLKIMILEVFKTVNRFNPSCLHDLFTKNEVVYDLRTQKLEQPKRRTTTCGLRTFSYLGSKLWNLLASEYSEVNDIDYERLKFLIKYWAGPNHDSAQGHFLWSTFWGLTCVF